MSLNCSGAAANHFLFGRVLSHSRKNTQGRRVCVYVFRSCFLSRMESTRAFRCACMLACAFVVAHVTDARIARFTCCSSLACDKFLDPIRCEAYGSSVLGSAYVFLCVCECLVFYVVVGGYHLSERRDDATCDLSPQQSVSTPPHNQTTTACCSENIIRTIMRPTHLFTRVN